MKRIKAEFLDQILYSDRAKEKEVVTDGEVQTVRSQLKQFIDLPIKDRKITREITKTLDKIYESLTVGDLILEDADFKFLSKHIDDIGILNPVVYRIYSDLVESAEVYKVN